VVKTGELESTDLSQTLRALDLALSANPRALVGKSGTVAAFVEHGVPVLVSRDDWESRHGKCSEVSIETDANIIFSPQGSEIFLDEILLRRRPDTTRRALVAQRFIGTLEDATPGLRSRRVLEKG
jgi:hypothetical protein